MDKSIKQCVPDNENAKAYLAAIGKQFPKFDKAEIGNSLAFVVVRYWGNNSYYEFLARIQK